MGVRHKATDKVRLAVVQGAHQLGEGDLRCKVDIDLQHESSTSHQVDGGHGLAAAALLLLLALLLGGGGRLARVVAPQVDEQDARGGRLHQLDHGVVDRVLVLVQPSGDVVGHDAGIVGDGKVGVLVTDTLVAKFHISVLLTKDISSSTSTAAIISIQTLHCTEHCEQCLLNTS